MSARKQKSLMREFEKQMKKFDFELNTFGYNPQTLYKVISLGTQYIQILFFERVFHTEISIHVGISAYELENIYAEIMQLHYDENEPRFGTIGRNIGYLMPENRSVEWMLTVETNIKALAAEIASNVIEYALPQLHAIQTIHDVLSYLVSKKDAESRTRLFQSPIDGARIRKVVIAAYLTGDRHVFDEVCQRELEFFEGKEIETKALKDVISKLS